VKLFLPKEKFGFEGLKKRNKHFNSKKVNWKGLDSVVTLIISILIRHHPKKAERGKTFGKNFKSEKTL